MPEKSRITRATINIALAATLTALVCVGSASLAFPLPYLGWFTPGDALVMLVGVLFGPVIGLFSGGIGSALADIVVGFGRFAPYTFIAKGGEGFISGLPLYLILFARRRRNPKVMHPSTKLANIANLIGVISGGAWMVISYFLTIAFLYRPESALLELPGNILQVVIGVAISIPISHFLIPILRKTFPGIFEKWWTKDPKTEHSPK